MEANEEEEQAQLAAGLRPRSTASHDCPTWDLRSGCNCPPVDSSESEDFYNKGQKVAEGFGILSDHVDGEVLEALADAILTDLFSVECGIGERRLIVNTPIVRMRVAAFIDGFIDGVIDETGTE